MASEKRMSLQEFEKKFSTEEQCRAYLQKKRWPNGFVCPKCGARHAVALSNGLFQCSKCRHQTSVTAGTVLHRSHLPLTKWFLAIYFVSQDKRGISAVELQARLGVTYKTAWYVLSRIRKAMGQRDDAYRLENEIEFDDAFFGGPTVGKKRGRGTEKAKVFVALSLDKKGHPRFLKMKKAKDVTEFTAQLEKTCYKQAATLLRGSESALFTKQYIYNECKRLFTISDKAAVSALCYSYLITNEASNLIVLTEALSAGVSQERMLKLLVT